MHQQRDIGFLHAAEDAFHPRHIGDAVGGIRRRPGRVELDRRERARSVTFDDVIAVRVVGQVTRHQRGKIRVFGHVFGQSGDNAPAVGVGFGGDPHWRAQVGHDDGAGETPGSKRQHRLQHVAVAQVQVPVVGPSQGDFGGFGHIERQPHTKKPSRKDLGPFYPPSCQLRDDPVTTLATIGHGIL